MTGPGKTNKALFDLKKCYTCIQGREVSYVDPKLDNVRMRQLTLAII